MEPDPEVIGEMRRMAVAGSSPYAIADMVWNGVAGQGSILWIYYMVSAFGIPLGVCKTVSTDPDRLNAELAEWVNPAITFG